MAATPNYGGQFSGFIPQATGLAVAYVTDPKRFKINEYWQIVKAESLVSAYAVLDPDAPVRVVTDQEFDWPDNQPRPKPGLTQGNFVWNEVRIPRRNYGYQVGEQFIDTAKGWNPRAFFNAIVLSLAMVNRTKRVMSLLTTPSNWNGNTSDATVLNGGAGTWKNASSDPASPNYLAIKKSILQAARNIDLSTNGMVGIEDMVAVMSPDVALMIAETSEVHDYLKDQVNSIQVIKGDNPPINRDLWGIPDRLYGLKVVVDNTSNVTQRPNTGGSAGAGYAALDVGRSYVWPNNSVAIVSRPGGLRGNYGSPSFSTVQGYFYEYELAIEAFHEVKDKLYETHVVDQFKEVLAATRAGWLITNVR